MDGEQRIERARARAALYYYLSALFVYPEDALWQALQETTTDDVQHIHSLLGWSAEEAACLQKRLKEMTREQFEAEHVAIFGFTAAGELRPYEAGYGTSHVFQETHCLADVAGFYRAFGLEPCEAQRERPDHIAVELEFMHVLALKEAYGLAHGLAEEAEVCGQAETDFLRDHLGRWAPGFLKHLGDRTGGAIFELIAHATAACLEEHCRDIGIRLESEEVESAPSTPEPEGTNFSCPAPCVAGLVSEEGAK